MGNNGLDRYVFLHTAGNSTIITRAPCVLVCAYYVNNYYATVIHRVVLVSCAVIEPDPTRNVFVDIRCCFFFHHIANTIFKRHGFSTLNNLNLRSYCSNPFHICPPREQHGLVCQKTENKYHVSVSVPHLFAVFFINVYRYTPTGYRSDMTFYFAFHKCILG